MKKKPKKKPEKTLVLFARPASGDEPEWWPKEGSSLRWISLDGAGGWSLTATRITKKIARAGQIAWLDDHPKCLWEFAVAK
jgi:hypothetical protein